jgi:CPA2 family monovalent cation:H+ antiporter-2
VVYLTQNGASTVVMGERETARGMIAEGLETLAPASPAAGPVEAAAPLPPAQPEGPAPQTA